MAINRILGIDPSMDGLIGPSEGTTISDAQGRSELCELIDEVVFEMLDQRLNEGTNLVGKPGGNDEYMHGIEQLFSQLDYSDSYRIKEKGEMYARQFAWVIESIGMRAPDSEGYNIVAGRLRNLSEKWGEELLATESINYQVEVIDHLDQGIKMVDLGAISGTAAYVDELNNLIDKAVKGDKKYREFMQAQVGYFRGVLWGLKGNDKSEKRPDYDAVIRKLGVI